MGDTMDKSKISVWKVLLAGFVFMIISQVVHTIGSFLTMDYYLDPAYFDVWSKVMMPTAGPPPTNFYVYSIMFVFIEGVLLSLVYAYIKEGIPFKAWYKKGLIYGVILFLVAGISGTLGLYLLVNLPLMLLVHWAIQTLIIELLGGITIAWFNK